MTQPKVSFFFLKKIMPVRQYGVDSLTLWVVVGDFYFFF